VTTALELRDFFKHGGGYSGNGTAMATAALSKMNAMEIAKLVGDLAEAQMNTPGYGYNSEISAACGRWAEVDPEAALRFALAAKQNSFRSAAIGSIFANMAKLDPELARAKLATLPDAGMRRSAQASIMTAISIAHPDAWVAMVKEEPGVMRQYGGIGSIAAEWAVDDPAAAAARLKDLPASMQKGGNAAIAKVWSGSDPKAAMAWAASLSDPGQRNEALGAAAGGMAAQDPDGAMAALDSLDPTARRAGLASIFQTLSDRDYNAAIDRACALGNPADQTAAFKILLGENQGYSPYDYSGRGGAEQINNLIARLPAGALRTQALTNLGNSLSSLSREDADRILQGYPENERVKLQTNMLQNLSYNDPVRAMEIYQSLPAGQAESYTFQNILSYLSQQDPEAALKLAMSGKTPQEQSQGIASAISQLAHNDPAAAQRHLADIPAGPMRDKATAALAGGWGGTDPTAALAWANSLSGNSKTAAITAILPGMAQTDPKGAAETLGAMLASPHKDTDGSLNNAASNIVQVWGKEDPAAAATWVTSLADENLKQNTIQSLTYTWCREDPDAAGTWINNQPDGSMRDSAIRSMVSTLQQKDPATAFEWAGAMSNDQQRSNMMLNIAINWKNTDPTAARAALEKADLPDDRRKQYLQMMGPPPGSAIPAGQDSFEESDGR